MTFSKITIAETAPNSSSILVTVQILPGQLVSKAIAQTAKTSTELYLPPGEYNVRKPIYLPSGCRLIGE